MAPGVDTQPQPAAAQPKAANGGPVDRVKANELKENKVADRLGAQDMYIDGEKDTDWYHCTTQPVNPQRPPTRLHNLAD